MIKKIEAQEELVASAARQGVTICGTEAEIVLSYVKVHGYELLADDDFKLYLHDDSEGENHGGDSEQTIRDIVELCKELNEEMLMDSYSEESPDYDDQLELRKDTLILEAMLERAQQVIPPTIRRYDVVIIEHRKKVVPTLAASWAEAEGRVREMWENGEVIIEQRDFTGITLGGGASAQD